VLTDFRVEQPDGLVFHTQIDKRAANVPYGRQTRMPGSTRADDRPDGTVAGVQLSLRRRAARSPSPPAVYCCPIIAIGGILPDSESSSTQKKPYVLKHTRSTVHSRSQRRLPNAAATGRCKMAVRLLLPARACAAADRLKPPSDARKGEREGRSTGTCRAEVCELRNQIRNDFRSPLSP